MNKRIGNYTFSNTAVEDAGMLTCEMEQDPSKYWLWVSENLDSWVLGTPGSQIYKIDRIIATDVIDFLIASWIITAPPGGCTPDNLEEMSEKEKGMQIALGTQLQMTGYYRLWYTYFPRPHTHFRTAYDFSPAERTQGIEDHRSGFFKHWGILEFITGLPMLEDWRMWVPSVCQKYLKEEDTIVLKTRGNI